MYYKAVLESLIKDLAGRVQQAECELEMAPEGCLCRAVRKQGTYYYQKLPPRGFRKKTKRVGITRDEEMIHRLARKRYVQESLSIARKNLQILQKACADYAPQDSASVQAALGGPYGDLSLSMFAPVFESPEPEAYNQWENNYMPEGLIHRSWNGVPMRTKSEVTISGRLGHFELAAEYEKPLILNGLTYHPDFTIRRPRDGKTFYWEHAGIMEDSEYRRRHDRKMAAYEEYGIVPWSNLIVTYDDAKGGVDVKLVDGLIHGWLL